MSSTYRTVDNGAHQDFRYNKYGVYKNDTPIPRPFRRGPKQDRTNLRGVVCMGCGITRSMTNKCECNS